MEPYDVVTTASDEETVIQRIPTKGSNFFGMATAVPVGGLEVEGLRLDVTKVPDGQLVGERSRCKKHFCWIRNFHVLRAVVHGPFEF